ncbi:hypothetical protein [Dyadobacter crusticola]|uniref:hypothetical protein n=1 Tax=Dyadobacter crusticola TaxID=292407 RepID=UPI0004E0F806|nr:hypothetical protein [Dyadobacter crusticola]
MKEIVDFSIAFVSDFFSDSTGTFIKTTTDTGRAKEIPGNKKPPQRRPHDGLDNQLPFEWKELLLEKRYNNKWLSEKWSTNDSCPLADRRTFNTIYGYKAFLRSINGARQPIFFFLNDNVSTTSNS